MPKQKITAAIREILDERYGFEIYVIMKDGEQLIKRFVLDEGNLMKTMDLKLESVQVLKRQYRVSI